MANKKVLYCWNCGKKTVHTCIDRDTIGKGTDIVRPILAIVSAGMSEMTVLADYQCDCCKDITRSRH